MPAWMTSLLRELVPVPIAFACSSTIVSSPRNASARPTARPTTPAPMTTASTLSTGAPPQAAMCAANFATSSTVRAIAGIGCRRLGRGLDEDHQIVEIGFARAAETVVEGQCPAGREVAGDPDGRRGYQCRGPGQPGQHG